jgi:hypothetical protein
VPSEPSVFLDGELAVVRPDIARATESTCQRMDHGHRGAEREIGEIHFRRDNLVVPSLEVREDIRTWIRGCEVTKSMEETIRGSRCELF